MNFIKQIKEGVTGRENANIHSQFQRFSRGEFRNRAVIKARFSAKKWKIGTTPEFAKDMIREVAKKLGETKTNVKGAIVTTVNLKEDPYFKDILANAQVKQFQGVKRYLIDDEMSGKDILEMLSKFPKAFFGLSFKSEDSEVKIQPKAPKSGKPGKNGELPKANFCRLITTDPELGKSYVFEKPDFKDAEILHNVFVEEIIVPKDEKDFAKARELSIKKGRLERQSKIDDRDYSQEIRFEA